MSLSYGSPLYHMFPNNSNNSQLQEQASSQTINEEQQSQRVIENLRRFARQDSDERLGFLVL